jgi:hypothetical protein
MAEPVSWLLIEPGWRVEAADGAEVGRVEEVTGDSGADIFDGLAISFSLLGRQRYVPAEQVAGITQGAVRLKLDSAAIEALPRFDEPAEEIAVEPEAASRRERLETSEVLRPKPRAHGVPIVRRALEWLGRAGRR